MVGSQHPEGYQHLYNIHSSKQGLELAAHDTSDVIAEDPIHLYIMRETQDASYDLEYYMNRPFSAR